MQEKLLEYAKVVTKVGANVQKGQTIVVACPVECAEFGRLIAEEAYELGAREVVIRWNDDLSTRMKFLRADTNVFDEVADWLKTFVYEYANKKAALISISASDPEYLKGVDPDRLQRSSIAMGKELKDYYDMQMRGDFPWCVVSIPTPSWAIKVFPGIPVDKAVEKLWDAILTAVRITGDGKATDRWQEHISTLENRTKKMNEYKFEELIIKNSLGTDLSMKLHNKAKWVGVGEIAGTGAQFVANMPSEEIFTLPVKTSVNGVVYSSIPLSLDGTLVKDICFTLKDGKIVDAKASEGLDVLLKKLDVDEGARYFGEIALVPYNSPISNMGILFYNTLFDENASCHIAFGRAYPAFDDARDLTDDDLVSREANNSYVHVDFMFGTPDLTVTGITADNKEILIIQNGNFVI